MYIYTHSRERERERCVCIWTLFITKSRHCDKSRHLFFYPELPLPTNHAPCGVCTLSFGTTYKNRTTFDLNYRVVFASSFLLPLCDISYGHVCIHTVISFIGPIFLLGGSPLVRFRKTCLFCVPYRLVSFLHTYHLPNIVIGQPNVTSRLYHVWMT